MIRSDLCLGLSLSLTLASGPKYRTASVRGGRKGWWSAVARYPVFTFSSFVLKLGTCTLEKHAHALVADFLRKAPEFVYNGKPDNPFAFDSSFSISLASPSLLSLDLSNYQDAGGPHPNTSLETFNFGLVKGQAQQLSMRDLFAPQVNAEKEMNDLLMAKLRPRHLSFIEDGTVPSLTRQQLNDFVITRTGLQYMFSPYEVASYAEGPQFIEFKFSELPGLDPAGPLRDLLRNRAAAIGLSFRRQVCRDF